MTGDGEKGVSEQREGAVSNKRDYSATALLILVVLASLVPFLLVGAFLLTQYVAAERESALERVSAVASSLTATIDRELSARIETLQALAASRFLREGDVGGFAEVAKAAASVSPGDFVLADHTGQQLINTRAEPGSSLPMSPDLDAVRRVFDLNKPDVSDLAEGAVHARHLFTVRIPVTVDSKPRYAFGYIPRSSSILAIIDEAGLPSDWFAAVLDRQGRIIARSSRHDEFYGKSASATFVARLTGLQGRIESVDLEGRETVTAYRRSTMSDWRTAVWVPKKVLEDKANTALAALAGLSLVTLLVSLAAGYFVARSIRGPTRQLLDAAVALGAGRVVRFNPTTMREANVVGEALSDASRNIQLYMREISHRSKNLLAVIQSISRQTRRGARDLEDFGRLFDDRLQSLARSHDLLIERNWGGTLIRDLVTAQLSSFVDGGDKRVQIEGAPILLSPAASQHIGLAIHELATNASKYGALSVPEGKVRIAWSKGADAEGGERFRMSWVETGGPPLQTPTRKGFGRFVVEDAVGRGLMGTAKIDWNPVGLQWNLDAPSSGLVRDSELFGLPEG